MTIVVDWDVNHKTTKQLLQIIWATSWENLFLPYANNKDADQPAHLRSLVSVFVIHCLDSIIPPFSISEISRSLWLGRPVWVLPGRKPPKMGFLVTRLICGWNWQLKRDLYDLDLWPWPGRSNAPLWKLFAPHHKKTCLRGFGPVKTQTGLLRLASILKVLIYL